MDLARELSGLAAQVEWPPTPKLELVLEPRTARHRRRRSALVLAFVAFAAVAAAFAVPQSRGAILRFFQLGAATIVRVDRLPAAEERPLSAGIGPEVSLEAAKRALFGKLLVPPLDPLPPAHLRIGPSVSFVFSSDGTPVLLSEFPLGGGFLKKFVSGGTSVEGADFAGSFGFWVSGAVHDVYFQGASPRLAGNVLIWEHNGATYRLESPSLSKSQSIALARSLTRG